MFIHILTDVLRNSILITGLVVIMMMMIESLNIESKGRLFEGLRQSRLGGVLTGALLGVIPGCMGGFATVSLYTHKMLSFGALVAMMIASSGDEAFVLLAMAPEDALWIFCLLFGIAIIVGLATDLLFKKEYKSGCSKYQVHEADLCECGHDHQHSHDCEDSHRHGRHFTWKRALMFVGVAVFITVLATGHLEHEHEHKGMEHAAEMAGGINLLSEDWMNVMFAILSLVVLGVLIWASDHFVEEHLWEHIVAKHLPRVFVWTFGVLLLIAVLGVFLDIGGWIEGNTFHTALLIVLATLIGIIPESGPHLIFVTLYATGILPLPVLLASCISQDGHASLPLIAESKSSFLRAKIINCAAALVVGFAALAIC